MSQEINIAALAQRVAQELNAVRQEALVIVSQSEYDSLTPVQFKPYLIRTSDGLTKLYVGSDLVWEAGVDPAPTAEGSISDQSWIEDSAITPLNVSADFTGSDITYSLAPSSAALPTGLSLSSAGTISGTPTTPASQVNIVVRGTNSGGFADTAFGATVTEAAIENTYDILVLNDAEMQNVLDGTTTVTSGDVIALAPGTYDTANMSFSSQPFNVTWTSQFPANRAVIGGWSLGTSAGSGYFNMEQIKIEYAYPTSPAQYPFGVLSESVWSIINATSSPNLTAINIDDVECDGGLVPFLDGGRMAYNNSFIHCRKSIPITVTNCTIYHVMTGISLGGPSSVTIENNEFYRIHADPIALACADGTIGSGSIKNNHYREPAGHSSNRHSDFIQFIPNAASGNSFNNITIEGNTTALGAILQPSEVARAAPLTDNVFTSSFTIPSTEHGMKTVLTPSGGGSMVVTLPSAVGNKGEQFSCLQNGAGTVTFALNGSDTYNGGSAPTITDGAGATFVSDGAGNWDILQNGYREWFLPRDYSFTAGDLEDGLVAMIDASAGNVNVTLPPTGARNFGLSRVDNSTNTVTVTASSDNISLNGSTTTSFAMGPGYGLSVSRSDDGDWTGSEDILSFSGVFGNANGGNWSNIKIRGNIFQGTIRIEDDIPGLEVNNNTIFPLIYADRNGDGFIGPFDGNNAAYTSELSGATAIVQKNATAGTLGTDGGLTAPQYADNDTLALGNTDPIPTSVTSRWNGSTRADFEATTRAELITAALAKTGGPYDGTFVGAVGTTASNGYYDFDGGEINASLPAPVLSSSSPLDGATGVGIDAEITLTFDQVVEAGTGNITLRAGGSAIETFDVATGLGDNGGTVAFLGAVVTVTPGADMALNTAHSVRVASTAVVGAIYQTSYAGISDDTTLNFTSAASSLAFSNAITDPALTSTDYRYIAAHDGAMNTTTRNSYDWFTKGGASDEQTIDTTEATTMPSAHKTDLLADGSFVLVVDVREAEVTGDGRFLMKATGLDATTGYSFEVFFNTNTGVYLSSSAGLDHIGSADVSSAYGLSAGTVYRIWMSWTQTGHVGDRIIHISNDLSDDVDFRNFVVFKRAAFDTSDATMDTQIAALAP